MVLKKRDCGVISVATLMLVPAAARADEQTVPQAATVAVVGARSDERRNDTTMGMVVTRDEIARYGDQSIVDVLKRVPSIAIGRTANDATEIRMRGLGKGYTQILLNGSPVPANFSLDTITPDVIERIEVMRSATAEYSAQAIAGTINIVTRKVIKPQQREAALGASRTNGQTSTTLATQLADRSDDLKYVLAANFIHNRFANTALDHETRTDSAGINTMSRTSPQEEHGYADTLNLTGRLDKTLANNDSVVWQNYVNLGKRDKAGDERGVVLVGESSDFPDSDFTYFVRTSMLRSDLTWARHLDGGAKLEVQFGVTYSTKNSRFNYLGFGNANLAATHNTVRSSSSDLNYTAKGKYVAPLTSAHSLVFGWDGGYNPRNESRLERKVGEIPPAPSFDTVLDDHYRADIKRLAVYAQDEWVLSPRLSVYLGGRWETLDTVGGGGGIAVVRNRSSVASPLLQTLWKLSSNDQGRLALGRTYKAPSITDLVPRLTTVDNNNSPTNPNQQGNPDLRPELSWTLDVALEHYFGKGNLISVSAYARSIDNVMVQQLSQNWQGWVSRLVNGGHASARGIEFEAKCLLPSIIPEAPAVTTRFNLTRNWSSIDQVPGPNNRLDKQSPVIANLGLDYGMQGMPLTMGGTFTFQNNGQVNQSAAFSTYAGVKRELDVYALWKFNARSQLRFSAANLLRQDYVTWNQYRGDGYSQRDMLTTNTFSTIRLVFEQKF